MDAIVVSDTNIFIDLCSIGLLDSFFDLPLQIHTTDFVINELSHPKHPEQKDRVLRFYDSKKLTIKAFSINEVMEVVVFQSKCGNNVSITDCSVWLYAKENNYRLITGDSKLRKSAIASGTTVVGILFIFDKLVEYSILMPNVAHSKLLELSKINNRLPSKEIEKRIKLWGTH